MAEAVLAERLARIRMLLLDVDGVLTDGGVSWHGDGSEQKVFHIKDGLGLRIWSNAGGTAGIITGRSSPAVERRAAELGVTVVRQGVEDKWKAAEEVLSAAGLSWEEAAFVGDDLPDLPVILACGVGVAVADACDEVRAAADLVTSAGGGRGAVREVVERLLKARGDWEAVVGRYARPRPDAGPHGSGRTR